MVTKFYYDIMLTSIYLKIWVFYLVNDIGDDFCQLFNWFQLFQNKSKIYHLKGGVDSFSYFIFQPESSLWYTTVSYNNYWSTWSLCPSTKTWDTFISHYTLSIFLSTLNNKISFYDKQNCPCMSIFWLLIYFCIEYVNHDIAETKKNHI
jgi:hypothetical protein